MASEYPHQNGYHQHNGNHKGDEEETAPSPVTAVIEGLATVPQEHSSAYLRNYKTHQKGISHEEMVKSYSEWANHYDEDLCPGRYNGPQIAAEAMAEYYTSLEGREKMRVLDVAAGTGRVGHELYSRGFRNIDALEPSNGMMQILIGRGVYRQTYENSIGYEPIDGIPNDSYDSLVIAGGMGEGHIPVTAFDEMIRIVKPRGTVFIVMREEYLTYVKEYADKLEPTMQKLEMQGKWQQVSRQIVPEYSFNKNGVVYNYKIF